MNRKRRPNGKKNSTFGTIFIFLGIGIVLVNIFPEKWMLVILSAVLVVAGVIISKC
ncbi:MAG: hypothetical protein IJZ35_01625 [Clostridia bacterium]|nr:hypothetical protein [Clostridia bacterium]